MAERLYDGLRFRVGRLRVVVTLVAALTMAVLIGDMVMFQGIDPRTGGAPAPNPAAQDPVTVPDPVNPPAGPVPTPPGERVNQPGGGSSPGAGGKRSNKPTTPVVAGPPAPIPVGPPTPAPDRPPNDILNRRSGGGGAPPSPAAPATPRPAPEADCMLLQAAAGGLAGSCSRVERGYYWERQAERVASWGEQGVTWPAGESPLTCGAGSLGATGYTARGPEGGASPSGPGGWAADVVSSRPAPNGPELTSERCPADRCGIFAVVCSAVPRR